MGYGVMWCGVVCMRVHPNHYLIGIICICGCDLVWLRGCISLDWIWESVVMV